MERTIEDWSKETYANAQKEIEQQKREWELEQLKKSEASRKLNDPCDEDDDWLTYSSMDAHNQVTRELSNPNDTETNNKVAKRKPGRPPKNPILVLPTPTPKVVGKNQNFNITLEPLDLEMYSTNPKEFKKRMISSKKQISVASVSTRSRNPSSASISSTPSSITGISTRRTSRGSSALPQCPVDDPELRRSQNTLRFKARKPNFGETHQKSEADPSIDLAFFARKYKLARPKLEIPMLEKNVLAKAKARQRFIGSKAGTRLARRSAVISVKRTRASLRKH